jgi:hypothetical protein
MLLAASIHAKPLQVLPRPGPTVRQRGAYSRIRIVLSSCVAACALPGSEPVVGAKEI